MSKALRRLSLALAAVSLCASAAAAQTTLEWIVLSPEGEQFAALVPKEPLRLEQEVQAGELAASGQRYTATAGGARYVVWSLQDTQRVGERLKAIGGGGINPLGESRYLDLVAEAAWEFLVKPEFERLEAERLRTGTRKEFVPSMSYVSTSGPSGSLGREYSVRLENEGGPVYVRTDGERVYIAAALAPDPRAADSRRFVESFAVGTKTPNLPKKQADPQPVQQGTGTGTGTGAGTGIGPGRGGGVEGQRNVGGGDRPQGNTGDAAVNNDGPFRQSEVTKKAAITLKPEPSFTEGARKFSVTGVVRLRAVLSKTGEVTNISVVKYLPHGLTEKSMEAARRIRFEPAQKDGRAVSQYVVLEYNYNIY
jgi:TonB family protein